MWKAQNVYEKLEEKKTGKLMEGTGKTVKTTCRKYF